MHKQRLLIFLISLTAFTKSYSAAAAGAGKLVLGHKKGIGKNQQLQQLQQHAEKEACTDQDVAKITSLWVDTDWDSQKELDDFYVKVKPIFMQNPKIWKHKDYLNIEFVVASYGLSANFMKLLLDMQVPFEALKQRCTLLTTAVNTMAALNAQAQTNKLKIVQLLLDAGAKDFLQIDCLTPLITPGVSAELKKRGIPFELPKGVREWIQEDHAEFKPMGRGK